MCLCRYTNSVLYILFHFSIKPNKKEFVPIMPSETRTVHLNKNFQHVSRFKMFQNWYVTADMSADIEPRIIISTADENLAFVESFDSPIQYQFNENDVNNPLTPKKRYELNQLLPVPVDPSDQLIPKPLSMKIINKKYLIMNSTEWIIYTDTHIMAEARLLSGKQI